MVLTKKNLFLILILIIFFVGAFWLFFQVISNVIEQKKFVQAEVSRISEKYLTQPALEKIIREINIGEQDINEVSKSAFIGSDNELEFIKFLESLTNQKIDQKIKFDFNKKIKQDEYFKIPVEIVLQSNFHNIIQYLDSLERSDYYLEINLIKIYNLGSVIEAESNIRVTINGYIYSF